VGYVMSLVWHNLAFTGADVASIYKGHHKQREPKICIGVNHIGNYFDLKSYCHVPQKP